jgi:hypothetical protein
MHFRIGINLADVIEEIITKLSMNQGIAVIAPGVR